MKKSLLRFLLLTSLVISFPTIALANEDNDADNDGYPDCIEQDKFTNDHDNDSSTDPNDSDDDSDGIEDSNDQHLFDRDNDGKNDAQESRHWANNDNDNDKDGIIDQVEKSSKRNDTDNDGSSNSEDNDDDKDGLLDQYEGDSKMKDTDNDEKNNRKDTDHDDDGIKNWKEQSCKAVYKYNCPTCQADFALYDPSYENDGVWEEEVLALKAMFENYGWSYETISQQDINNGALYENSELQYRAVIAPGGWAYYRELALTATGEDNLRTFINQGGNFVGFCAGAYWVNDLVVFAEEGTDYEGPYNYHTDLLIGTAQGPFGWTPWNNGTNASLEPVNITSTAVTQSIGLPSQTRFFYYGGPFFTNITTEPDHFQVWATAQKPAEASSAASTGEGESTIIRFGYGKGDVVLFSYHPEILIDSTTDNVTLSEFFNENSMDWDTGTQTQNDINIDSWNIVHAALQVASNKKITPVNQLP